ncbi:TonB-dependent receptor plug domain-containing protein [Piscinibacter terrae]|uniref:TonB-dependent receptor n=1 Tax=Piscinibacter terrae TaxID=2496871 RepID=A0A3N7JY80_9BURK|nr:TonB-dependent receptor [Albitalea terrae]RQP23815.1 TonB-dependent receptor [Albitalea terrae]
MKKIPTCLLAVLAPLVQAAGTPSPRELATLSLEDLANIEVISTSRHAERLSDAAASIFVITAEDIRRSGATTLPEALRLAPNLQVGRLDAGQYAISARGFNNAIGNKLLVLVDGRTVYTPFFSGVFWDQQDVMLDDVDRIEVVSGPGATLWGANAVNGVINVITRPASHSQGGLGVAGGGNREAGASARYGGELGTGNFRLYARASQLQNTRNTAGASVADGWDRTQAGFRMDWGDQQDGVTLQGDIYEGKSEDRGSLGPFPLGAVKVSGANILGRWTHALGDGSSLRIQAYVDHTRRIDALIYSPKADILDVEIQHARQIGRHDIVWGVGYRRAKDDIQPGVFFGFNPAGTTMGWANLFAQDEVELTQALKLTLGAKLEHNDFTGTEALPTLRLAWKPGSSDLLWGGLSRAVRAPARLDRELFLPPRAPFLIAGGPDFDSEVAKVAELGYRAQPNPSVSYSVTVFRHWWDKLRSGQKPPNAHVQNMIDGTTQGLEAWGQWQAMPSLRLSAGLTTLHKDLKLKPGSTDPDGPKNLGDDPTHQWVLRAAWTLLQRHELDVSVRHVGELPVPAVQAYTAVDLRYAIGLNPQTELALSATNLFDPSHVEFITSMSRSEIPRAFALTLRWTP